VEECEVGLEVVALGKEVEFAQAVESLLRAIVHLQGHDQGRAGIRGHGAGVRS